eukprot:gene12663-14971_t
MDDAHMVIGDNSVLLNCQRYTIRCNGSEMMDKNELDSLREKFTSRWRSVDPDEQWRRYYTFSNVQNAFDQAIIDHKLQEKQPDTRGVQFATFVKQFPWVHYKLNLGGTIASIFFGVVFTFAFISSTVLIMKSVVMEKELRLREGMQMMGLSDRMYWGAWFLTHWSNFMLVAFLVACIGTFPFEYTDPFILFLFMVSWGASLVTFCYFLSCFFNRSRIAAIVSSIIYISGMAPAIAMRITYRNGHPAWTLVCLLPAGAINMWGWVMAVLENGQRGITFRTMHDNLNSDGHFSAGVVFGMVWFDIFFYALLACPFFPFQRRYWESIGLLRPRRLPAASDLTTGAKPGDEHSSVIETLPDKLKVAKPMLKVLGTSAGGKERMAVQMKPAVHVHNLCKQFGNVSAVEGLSLSFAEGHVSALLGHNGAGKTTTINILTGMLEATSGLASIGGLDVFTHMDEIRCRLGVCPQFDILWPQLTVLEHLRLYANFQGVPEEYLEAEVMGKVEEVGLMEKVEAPVSALSGGQKRKLSLAISFLGNPSCVFLDEPTSGMDPFSRRKSWAVIRNNRK